MKIAVSGKGGVGKSTIAAAIALALARRGERVLALDTDPDANLAAALGIMEPVTPISQRVALIEERTGAKVDGYGQVFKMNPRVDDVAGLYAVSRGGVDLLVLGGAQKGGGGCACAENSFVRALVSDLVLFKRETLVMDMEAGIEHLGRATASGVDVMIIVVEPGRRAVDCANAVLRMGGEVGIKRFLIVGNKVENAQDERFIADALAGWSIAAYMPYAQSLRAADRDGVSVLDAMTGAERAVIGRLLDQIDTHGAAVEPKGEGEAQ